MPAASRIDAWNLTLVAATVAVALAAAGLLLNALSPGAAPVVSAALLATSLGATGVAFTFLAMRVHRLELENEGLIEEISQEFQRVKDRIEIFGEALAPDAEAMEDAARRVVVK